MVLTKEYIAMRSAEPIKFLLLRKMGIVGKEVGKKKKATGPVV